MKTYKKFVILGLVLMVGVLFFGVTNVAKADDSYEYYTGGFDSVYDYDYGTDYGYGNGYGTDYGYGNGYGTDYGYGNGYGTDYGYDYYDEDCYGCNDYGSSYGGSNYGCSYNCGGSYSQPYQPRPYQPTTTYHPPSYSPPNYTPTCSYGCGSTPSYIPPAPYHPTTTYIPVTNDNLNENTNVVIPITSSGATSSSSVNSVNNNYLTSSTTVSNTFNPVNSINNSNPINIVVNVPRDQNNSNPTPNLSAYCVAVPSNPQIGTTVTWQATASGGSGSYTYSWSGDVFGGGQTVTNTYYSAGNKNAIVTVTSNGQQATASCSTYVQPAGSTISNVTVYQQPQTPLGTPSAGVFLSQIPATGISPGLKMALFVLGLFMWSAFGAYMILQKRKMATLAVAGAGMDGMILAENMEDEAEESVSPAEENLSEDLESNLSFRARENNVLISRDGLSAIMDRAGNDAITAEAMLSQVISKVARNEGDYATLNGEKVTSLLNS